MKTIKDLENEKDKLSIFKESKKLAEYIKTNKELLYAFTEILNDNEKLEIMKQEYFKKQPDWIKTNVVMSITDNSVKKQIMQDMSIVETVFDKYSFHEFVYSMDEEGKIQVIRNKELLHKFNVQPYVIKELIIPIQDDELKTEFMEEFDLHEYEVYASFSDEKIKSIIIEDKSGLKEYQIIRLINSLSIKNKIDFLDTQKDFLESKKLSIYDILREMSTEQQLQFVDNIENLKLTEKEKRTIFAVMLKNETKQKIDINQIDIKYRKLIEMEVSEINRIILKLDKDVSIYAGLDELLDVNPLNIVTNEEERKKFLKLCKICPNMKIKDNLKLVRSTTEEYIKGEEWIDSVLNELKPEWTDIQKIAYIDMAIGKKISYSPDYGTEVEKIYDVRALWKIITNGYGVCNGIAQIEQYILGRIGVECEIVGSRNHAFIKVKNIDIPTKNGSVKGDTLIDPTWNLATSRYGGKPEHFCRSYEELRKADINSNGEDIKAHKNDSLENTNTIEMDEESLREVYKSIGVADKDGNFPIKELVEQVTEIDESSKDIQTNINRKFELLKKYCPEFATCQNSTIKVIKSVLFESNEKFNFKKCIASRVFDKEDTEKKAVLYVYFEFEDKDKKFYYADKSSGEFIELSQEEFELKFDCYQTDIEKNNDKRLWEDEEEKLEQSTEGDAR